MRKATIVIALVVIVVALFLLKPDLLGSGADAPNLAVVTAEKVMNVPTDIACSTAQDCIDYVLSEDPGATDVKAVCSGTCTFITEKTPVEVQP
jgi:hypothetical protein